MHSSLTVLAMALALVVAAPLRELHTAYEKRRWEHQCYPDSSIDELSRFADALSKTMKDIRKAAEPREEPA